MNETNVKWHQLSAEDCVLKQQSNAALGLSRKAARSRSKKHGKNTLFDVPRVQSQVWRSLWTDPTLWIMPVIILMCLLSSHVWTGILSAIFYIAGLCFCVYVGHRTARMQRAAAPYRVPFVHVVREGKELVLSARDVVPGDLILLRAGDIVPCDCRLLHTDAHFSCLSVYPDREGRIQRKQLPKNADTVYPYRAQQFAPFFENMLYGRSEILSGEAVALATEIAHHTFFGAMALYNGMEHRESADRTTEAVAPILRVYSIFSYILLVPLVLIALFTTDRTTPLLRIFAPVCALLVTSSRGVMTLLFRSLTLRSAEEIYNSRPPENRAILKGKDAGERLSSITDLIVLGKYASSDGKPHLYRVATGEGIYGTKNGTPDLHALSEAFCLLRLATPVAPPFSQPKVFPRRTIDDELSTVEEELCTLTSPDEEELAIRIRSAVLTERNEKGRILDIQSTETSYRIVFSEGDGMLHHCTAYEDARGRAMPLSPQIGSMLKTFAQEHHAEGSRILTVIRQIYNRNILLGVLALREETQALLPSVLEELKQSGVRVRFFLEMPPGDAARYASNAGLPSSVYPQNVLPTDPEELLRVYAGHSVFGGIDKKEILRLTKTLKTSKKRVAVIGCTPEDLSIVRSAALSIACEPLVEESGNSPSANSQFEGTPYGNRACPSVREEADLLICRTHHFAGGLPAILQAISFMRASTLRAKLLLRFLAVSQLLRWGTVGLALLFGVGLISAPQILFSGLCTDLLAYVWILHLPILQGRLRKKTVLDTSSLLRCLKDRSLWMPPSLAYGVLLLLMLLLGRFGILSGAAVVSSLFFSLLLSEIALLYAIAIRSGHPTVGKIWLLPLAPLLPAALALLASLLYPPLAMITEVGGWHPLGIVCTLLSPVLVLLAVSIFSHFRTASK